MALPNVLVGVITHAGEKDKRERFLYYLKKVQEQEPNPDVFIVTNSGDADKKDIDEVAQKVGLTATVVLNKNPAKVRLDVIVQNRNLVREHFLEKDYSHLFFLDSDLTGGLNALTLLCHHEKKIVCGWYLNGVKIAGKPQIRPVAFLPFDETRVRQLKIAEMLKSQLMPLAVAGLGCMLIPRDVLEAISFRRLGAKGGEDVAFCADVYAMFKERIWCDTRIKYIHHKFPEGDKRAGMLNPNNYHLKEGQAE